MKRLSLCGLAAKVIRAFCSINVMFLSKLGETQSVVSTRVARDDFALYRGQPVIKVDSDFEATSVDIRVLHLNQPTPRQPDQNHIKASADC